MYPSRKAELKRRARGKSGDLFFVHDGRTWFA
jgi:hypothetical protein